MTVIQTSETPEGKNRPVRIFTINLKPAETKHIFDSPHFLYTPKTKSNIQFQVMDRGDAIDDKDLKFRLTDEIFEVYTIATKTGFQSDEKHLEYLTGLQDIPMVFGENETVVGYVRFRKQEECFI